MSDKALVKTSLSPQQRVAVLLASLDPDVSAKVMQELDPEIMSRAVEEIRKLGMVPGHVRKQAISESLDEILSINTAVFGGDGVAVDLLGKVVGEHRAASILDLGQAAGSHFSDLAVRRPKEIAALLKSEPVGVCALVLRHLPSDLSAKSLALFDEERRKRIVLQIANADLPSEEVIVRIEEQLSARLSGDKEKGADDEARMNALVSILQRSSRDDSDALLDEIERESPELAAKLRDEMFIFEDFVQLSDAAIRRVLQDIDTGTLPIALRKASEEVKKRFFDNMSRRASEALLEEMEFSAKMPFSEVASKQKEIVEAARRLAAEGEIQLLTQDDEYV